MKKLNVNIGLPYPPVWKSSRGRNTYKPSSKSYSAAESWTTRLVDLAIDRALAPPLYNWFKQEPHKKQRGKGHQKTQKPRSAVVVHKHCGEENLACELHAKSPKSPKYGIRAKKLTLVLVVPQLMSSCVMGIVSSRARSTLRRLRIFRRTLGKHPREYRCDLSNRYREIKSGI
jgi:hypothetical protein